jgi:GT2 family glycosyltransferase
MRIRVLMITHKRPAYTALSLRRLCESVPEQARITVWDNASGDEMRAVLESFQNHPRVEQIVYHPRNDKLRGPTNWFWANSGAADFLSKVDDDCLMPPNWCETLLQAHADIPQAGVLGCWRFLSEDFDEGLAARKIQQFAEHRIMRNCWVEGSGYLMKREVVDRIGLLREGESFTSWCTRAAASGFVNGWYFPFLYQEHLDDPRVPNTGIRSEADFRRLLPLSANTFKISSREDWIKRLKYSAWSLQAYSFDPKDHLGWRARVGRKLAGLLGKPYLPRA